MEYKTCQFIDSYYPIIDGVATVVDTYAKRLNGDGFSCKVAAPAVNDKNKYKDEFPYEVYRATSLHLRNQVYVAPLPFLDASFHNKLYSNDFDIVHAHSPGPMGRSALGYCKKRNVPLVASFHTKYYDNIQATFKSEAMAQRVLKMVLKLFEEADSVWAVSDYAGRILRGYGLQRDYEVMTNGTDMREHIFTPDERIEFENRIELPSDKLMLLYVGQISLFKNLEFSLEAICRLRAKTDNFIFYLVGNGPDTQLLTALTQKLGIADCVRFVGKISDREELARYYSRADLFIMPSRYETSSLVFMEAAACRTPSAVIENTVLSESVVNGFSGFCCSDNVDNYTQMIYNALTNPSYLKSISDNAKNTLVKTSDDIIKEVKQRYERIIEKHKSKQG